MTIVVYDIYTNFPERSMSYNTWRVRYALNLKSIPHRTEWLELGDIEPFYKKHNIPTNVKTDDGTPRYTIPLIYDPATNRYINDSPEIAAYLDAQYPEPKVFPHGTRAVQELVDLAFTTLTPTRYKMLSPIAYQRFNPATQDVVRARQTAAAESGSKEPEATQEQMWANFEEGCEKAAQWYEKSDGPFLMGETLTWADFVVASHFHFCRIVWGKESKEWKEIESWSGGRWGNLLKSIEQYMVFY